MVAVVRVYICLIDLVVVRCSTLRRVDAPGTLHNAGELQHVIDGVTDFRVGVVNISTRQDGHCTVIAGQHDIAPVRDGHDLTVRAIHKADALAGRFGAVQVLHQFHPFCVVSLIYCGTSPVCSHRYFLFKQLSVKCKQ